MLAAETFQREKLANLNLTSTRAPIVSFCKNKKLLCNDAKLNINAVKQLCLSMKERKGASLNGTMQPSGLRCIDNDGTIRCDACGFELAKQKPEINPYLAHETSRPDCPSIRASKLKTLHTNTSNYVLIEKNVCTRNSSTNGEQENPSKRQRIDGNHAKIDVSLVELDKIQQIRRRTFSHWPHRTSPSQAQMIEAGFFCCNVGDRVICIYCNLICQQWTPHVDDPCEVHKTVSPHCIYVQSKLMRPENRYIEILNETTTGGGGHNASSDLNGFNRLRSNEFVLTAASNAAYTEIPKRTASFASWPTENLPPVDELVRAGFFYTGTKTIVTCFYCNGSLQNWGPIDNPMIEHARWFPHCAYAKQLCGNDLYRKIQESKRAQQERSRMAGSKEQVGFATDGNSKGTSNDRKLIISDDGTLARLVAARLDLPISQQLMARHFKLSIIKRCWEDQLRIKQNDFESESDLHMACIILQKQIDRIDGKKENITVPSIKMKALREKAEKERTEAAAQQQLSTTSTNATGNFQLTPSSRHIASDYANEEMSIEMQSATNESTLSSTSSSTGKMTISEEKSKIIKPAASSANEQNQTNDSPTANSCVLCLSEEKRLACIPCGHLATCVPCGHSLRSCPICRRDIEAFVRIYV